MCERQPWPLGCVCEGGLHCIMSGLHYGLLASCGRIGSSASCLMDCSPSNCLNVYVKTLPYSPAQGFGDFPERRFCTRTTMSAGCKWTQNKKNNKKKKWNKYINKWCEKQNRNVTIRKTRQIKDVSHRRWDAGTWINRCSCNLWVIVMTPFDTLIETNMSLVYFSVGWSQTAISVTSDQMTTHSIYLTEPSKTELPVFFFFLFNSPAWVTQKRCCKSLILHLQNNLKLLKVLQEQAACQHHCCTRSIILPLKHPGSLKPDVKYTVCVFFSPPFSRSGE